MRGAGHRVLGHRASQYRPHVGGRKRGISGHEYVHVMIDDHSRLAYAEVLDDLTARCAIAFLRRAVAWFGERGVRVQAVMTDNGSCYVAHAYRQALVELGLGQLRIKPGRPRTNGKAERFTRRSSTSGPTRAQLRRLGRADCSASSLREAIRFTRPHGSFGHQAPASRLNNLVGNYS